MKVFNTSFTLSTEERCEVSDITKLIREAVQQFPVASGIALINTLHTTCALFINEFQSALVDDLKSLIERLVPERAGYRHDDPRYSDCERGNASSHLRAALLGAPVVLGDVAQRADQVREHGALAQRPRLGQHARVGLLDEVLGQRAGTADRVGDVDEAGSVFGGDVGVEEHELTVPREPRAIIGSACLFLARRLPIRSRR